MAAYIRDRPCLCMSGTPEACSAARTPTVLHKKVCRGGEALWISVKQGPHHTMADKERESDVNSWTHLYLSNIGRRLTMINIPVTVTDEIVSELHDGEYTMVFEKSEERIPYSGIGNQLFIMLRSVGPDAIGAVAFDHITLESNSRGAVYYGARKLKQLLVAVGLGDRSSFEPAELIGKVVRATIRMKHTDKWGWQPEIVAYSKAEETPASDSEPDTDESEADDAETDPESIPF